MPKKSTTRKAKRIQRSGKRASTAAGPFVREEMHKRKPGKGARSRKQAVAIGLSKARRAGVAVKKKGSKRRASTGRKRSARKAPARRARVGLSQRRRSARRRTQRRR